MRDDRDISLTKLQSGAFKRLESAFKECQRLGMYLWDNYGSISAVNGRDIKCLAPDDTLPHRLDEDMVSSLSVTCWHGSNADDKLFIRFKNE